ncbi:hypothetical protein NLG97_g2356 [Lecanicillium saksenae]|uniref:Uncharacterized protein n=1 Tax=Lecanicillium saksenae TaxID=468837 RepID=A0ACC1R4F2_9HYPO|nr:hypothetical protein NLG97_g2356 [Lecanicillium saksenae]
MSVVGSLTTTFTPAPSCASHIGYIISSADGGTFAVRGPLPAETECFPPGFPATEQAYYSPALCPSGFTTAALAAVAGIQVAKSTALCCPSVASMVFVDQTSYQGNITLPTQLACVNLTSAATVAPLTRVIDGSTITTDTTISTSATIAAYGVRVIFTSDDTDNVLEQPPDPERFNKVRLTYTNGTTSLHHDALSPGGKIGVGVGACFAAGLMAFGVLLLWRKKHYAHQQKPSMVSDTSETYEAVQASPRQIRRKPVASMTATSVSSMESPEAGRGYQPVMTTESPTDGRQSDARDCRKRVSDDLFFWKWEMLSIFISILTLLAMIVVLHVYESHLLEDWKPPISINAVISILSAIFKGSLGPPISEGISQLKWLFFTRQPGSLAALDSFDKASRGAWGSTLLIFDQFRAPTKSYVTSFGAMLAIVALITDPFAQATISLDSCQRNGSDIASIPRANHYTVTEEALFRYNPSSGVSEKMQLAAYIGALNPAANSSLSVPVLCTTGNCTYHADGNATFSTLTMCSSTWSADEDITSLEKSDGWTWSLGFGNEITQQSSKTFNASFITLPNTTRSSNDGSLWNSTSLLDVFILSMVRANDSNCDLPECTQIYQLNGERYKPKGFTFSLFPCVKTFSAGYTAGKYSEQVISEDYLHYFPDRYVFQLAVDRTIINGTWRPCTATESLNDSNTIQVWPPEEQQSHLKIQDRSDKTNKWYAPECVFEFNRPEKLSKFLGNTFFTDNRVEASTWANKLWRNGTTSLELVTAFADGLAISMGAEIRKGAVGPDMLREARGTTVLTKTCIRVHWSYLSFFAALFVLELLFLLVVIVLTHRSQLNADWKSSTLAVAFLGGGRARRKEWPVDRPESERSLRHAAKDVKVSLVSHSGDWKLATEDSEKQICERERPQAPMSGRTGTASHRGGLEEERDGQVYDI